MIDFQPFNSVTMKKILLLCIHLIAIACSSQTDDPRVINADKLSRMISQKDKTLVYVWTTWCSGCRKTLAETLPRLQEDLDSGQYQILLIAASKNRQEVDSLIANNALRENTYFLNFTGPDKGAFQNLGIKFLLEETFPEDELFTRGIPVFFLIDRNKKVLHKKIPHTYNEARAVLFEHH